MLLFVMMKGYFLAYVINLRIVRGNPLVAFLINQEENEHLTVIDGKLTL